MKKMFMLVAMLMMMSLCSICSATPGKVLDSELYIVEKFFAAPNYKAVQPLLAADLQKEFNEEAFNKFKELTDKNFGTVNKNVLRVVTKYDDADVLEFRTSFSKIPLVAYVFAFTVDKEKPLMRNFTFQLPKQAAPAPAGAPAAAPAK